MRLRVPSKPFFSPEFLSGGLDHLLGSNCKKKSPLWSFKKLTLIQC